MRRYAWIFVFPLLFAAGCASAPKPEAVKPAAPVRETISEKELLPIAGKLMRQQLEAIGKEDYEAWKKTMHPKVLAKTDEKSFRKMVRSFRSIYKEPAEIRFLGSVEKFSGRMVLWKGKFKRGPALEALMRKKQIDPDKTPLSDSLITLTCVQEGKQWLVVGFSVN